MECQQVESSRWMEQQQKSATGQFGVYARNDAYRSIGRAQSPRWCVGLYGVPARRDTLEWLWSAPYESVQPVYRWPACLTGSQCSQRSSGLALVRPDPALTALYLNGLKHRHNFLPSYGSHWPIILILPILNICVKFQLGQLNTAAVYKFSDFLPIILIQKTLKVLSLLRPIVQWHI